MKRRSLVLGGPVLVCAADVPALDGTAAPAEVRQALGPTPHLRGSARLRAFGLHIYDAQLWVGEGFEPQRFETAPLALTLTYARGLKGGLIAERSLEEMRRGGPIAAADAQRWLGFMTETFPDVRSGDRITGIWRPGESRTLFHVNGGAARELRDLGFGTRFFGIWLAPHTSQPAMRQQLLGLSS